MKTIKSLTSVVFGTAVTACGMLSYTLPGQAITISTSGGEVGNVDVSTGIFTPFLTNSLNFTDIAVNDDGELFGNTFGRLYSISPGSPMEVMDIGALLINNANALGFDNNGVLYAAGSNDFYSVNTSTGRATVVSNSLTGFLSAGDIVFNPAINQFLATSTTPDNSTLFSIALDGAATEVGSIGFNNVFGLGFNSGTLYGYTTAGEQLIIDPTTGSGIFDKNLTGFTGSILGASSSLDQATPPPTTPPTTPPVTSVPEPMNLAGIMMLGFMGLCMKGKKRKPLQSA